MVLFCNFVVFVIFFYFFFLGEVDYIYWFFLKVVGFYEYVRYVGSNVGFILVKDVV